MGTLSLVAFFALVTLLVAVTPDAYGYFPETGFTLLQTRAKVENAEGATVADMAAEAKPTTTIDVASQRGILLRYMPKHNVAICACAKCGTTSLYKWIFKNEFGHSFNDDPATDLEFMNVHDVQEEPWKGTFLIEKNITEQDRLMKEAFTFVLVRDPKERLISAWQQKLACGKGCRTDVDTRKDRTASLLKLWGRKDHADETCMSLDRFLGVLRDIHDDGNAFQLDGHFMPQQHACFAHDAPAKWGYVSDISGPEPFEPLAAHLGLRDRPYQLNACKNPTSVSKEAVAILDEITVQEYAVLRPYLSRPSRVHAGEYLLQSNQSIDTVVQGDAVEQQNSSADANELITSMVNEVEVLEPVETIQAGTFGFWKLPLEIYQFVQRAFANFR